MTDSPVLACADLYAGYDGAAVVRDFSLGVAGGEIVALLGANGAGKTTVLLTLSGILQPISGTLELLGQRVNSLAPERRARLGLGYVADDRCLFGSLTTVDNLTIANKAGGLTVEEAFEMFPALKARSRVEARLLSGGEQQMLVLCRALGQNPKVLMLDEMSTGLAPTIVESILPVLRDAADRRGIGVLLVEQHVHLAMSIADRAYVLSHGDLVLTGDASELRRDPSVLERAYLGESDHGPVTS